MIEFRSFLQDDDTLIPIEEATKPPPDEDYIDGVVEMLVDGQPILGRDKVDLVDQLWAYLIQGLEQLSSGEDFSTFYPDMPLEVRMTRRGTVISITSDDREKVNRATVELEDLRQAMLPAAETFFRRIRELTSEHDKLYAKYLDRIARLRSSP